LLLGLLPALPGALLAASCDSRPVSLGLSLTAPEGLLSQATAVTLSVFDAAASSCKPTTGSVGAIPGSAQVFPLGTTGCASGDAWCTTITLDKDGSDKAFAVVATKAGVTIAEGCATKTIDQDPLVVDIQVFRYSPPACCNDGILEPGEQCDTGVAAACGASTPVGACSGIPESPICYCDCTAKEIPLSADDTMAPNLKNGTALTNSALALAFGPGGAENPEMLRAVFQASSGNTTAGYDLHDAFRAADLYPITEPVPLSQQLQFPVLCSAVSASPGLARDQEAPALATTSDDTVVTVYQTDQNSLASVFDVYLSPQLPDGCVDQPPCAAQSDCQTTCNLAAQKCEPAVQINDPTGGATDPHVAAGPPGMVLVTWTRTTGVYGRIWNSTGAMFPAMGELQIAPGDSASRVAGYSGGFRVVYQGNGTSESTGIFMRTVGQDGTIGSEVRVDNPVRGAPDQPNIAMLSDGTTLVVWHTQDDIWFQRYDAGGNPVPNDQSAPLNTTGALDETNQQHPAVTGANGYFVVAWESPNLMNPASGSIYARFVGATSGFGYNSVSGQNDDFSAVDPSVSGDRYAPAVAMSAYVAIGWEDHATGHPGIYVRRFPPPAD
jgi:hypothetical protein